MSTRLRVVGKPDFQLQEVSRRAFESALKRGIDVLGATLALLLLWPLLFCAALAIWSTMGTPIFFRQRRSGHRCSVFTICKLRTMKYEDAGDGNLLPDEDRLTPLGRWLRKTSIDELPQLWHVLTGQMSLVGPRPLFPSYLPRYTTFQRRRHEVRPGITGWAQINGRNAVTWEQRFELDVWYVDHWTIWLDLRILVKTLWAVFRCAGVTHPNHATMPEFRGTDNSNVHLTGDRRAARAAGLN